MSAFHQLVTSRPGVRRAGRADRWVCRGRLVARAVDETHVVVRVPFDVRDVLRRQHPDVFSVPTRFAKHMMVVADLSAADDVAVEDAVEDAVEAAWRLQADG